MAVCKFYRQGTCKFGDKCKFEHPPGLGPPQQAQNQNNFGRQPQNPNSFPPNQNAFARQPQNQRGPPGRDNNRNTRDPRPYGVTREILDEDLVKERPLWIMSGYGPGKEPDIQLFGGFPLEQSPEEIRVLHYEALAAGNPQQSAQMEAELAAKSNEQVQAVLGDISGALQYLANGSNQHPNRNDICRAGTSQLQRNGNGPFSRSTRQAQLNAQRRNNPPPPGPSGFQQSQQAGFGQPAMPQSTSFGTPNQPQNIGFGGGQGGGFGQQPQAQPTGFGQNAQGSFGNPPAQGGFGVPAAQPNDPLFGQNAQGFGQQNLNPPFGQQQPQPDVNASPFGQPGIQQQQQQPQQAQPNGFNNILQQPPQPQAPFGAQMNQQPMQPELQQQQPPANNLFGQGQMAASPGPMANGFQAPAQQQQQQPQTQNFGGGGGGGFGNPTAPQQQVPQPAATYGDVQSYTTRDPSSNKLLTWKGRPVNYLNGGDQPCYRRDDGSWERIWFPDGAPPAAASLSNGAAGATEYPDPIKGAYETLKESGQFKDGLIPDIAPSKELVRWDM